MAGPDVEWLQPIPDALVASDDPAAVAEALDMTLKRKPSLKVHLRMRIFRLLPGARNGPALPRLATFA